MLVEYAVNHNLLDADGRRFVRDTLDKISVDSHKDYTVYIEYFIVDREDLMMQILRSEKAGLPNGIRLTKKYNI